MIPPVKVCALALAEKTSSFEFEALSLASRLFEKLIHKIPAMLMSVIIMEKAADSGQLRIFCT